MFSVLVFPRATIFRIVVCLFAASRCGCLGSGAPHLDSSTVAVSFINVAQGTAQLVTSAQSAVAIDVGDTSGFTNWHQEWQAAGSPFLSTVILSHGHADHVGALAQLSQRIVSPTVCIISPFVDTLELRARMSAWLPAPPFKICTAGDTFSFGNAGVFMCLWPPQDTTGVTVIPGDQENRLSMVWQFKHGINGVLFGGDADTVALTAISRSLGEGLSSEILAVPHHGSSTGVSLAFWGFVHPRQAVISCGWPNGYGHPSPLLLDIAKQMGVPSHITGRDGTLVLRSNGYAWERVSLSDSYPQ